MHKTSTKGILVVDLFDDTTLNVIGFIDNPEVSQSHVAAYTGNNIVPGNVPAEALILASDVITEGRLAWRFEFNIARLKLDYPDTNQFTFVIKGRGTLSNSLSGAYIAKSNDSIMILTGSAGSFIPAVTGPNAGAAVSFGNTISLGADGSYAEEHLQTIITLVYSVNSDSLYHENPPPAVYLEKVMEFYASYCGPSPEFDICETPEYSDDIDSAYFYVEYDQGWQIGSMVYVYYGSYHPQIHNSTQYYRDVSSGLVYVLDSEGYIISTHYCNLNQTNETL